MKKRFCWAAASGLIIMTGCLGAEEAPDEARDVELQAASACPEPVEDQEAVSRTFLEVLYPDSDEDSAIACRWNSPDCSQRVTHMNAAPTGAKPPIPGCRSGTQPLMACYNAAVQTMRAGLDTGDASLLYEGAVRARDATLRGGSDDSAPPWLRNFGPANLLAKTFRDAGVAVDKPLADCVAGTPDQRYACLANGSRGQFRGLLGLLDHHAGVLARSGFPLGATDRAWSIFRSATAPVHAQIIQTGRINPEAGVRMNRIDLLGKYAVLRLLDGSAEETSGTELAHLVQRATYVPAGAGQAAPLFVPRFAVLLAAGASLGWDEVGHKPFDRDPAGAADVRRLWRTLTHGISLSALQGRCLLSQEFQDLRLAMSSLFSPGKFAQMASAEVSVDTFMDRDETIVELLLGMDITVGRACGWITSEDYVRAWSETRHWYEYETWEDCDEGEDHGEAVVTECHTCEPGDEIEGVECDCDLITYCTRRNIFGACTQEYSFQDCEYIVELEFSETTQEEERVADGLTFVQSVRKSYRELMAYYDAFEKVNGEWVKRAAGQSDGVIDMHYDPVAEGDATIALSYVDADACEEELTEIEAAFGSTGTLTCEAGDICGPNPTEVWPLGSWYPFPIATRLCPETAGKFGGVLADDGSDSWCATPWDFTKAVAHDWLPNADAVIEAIAEEDALDGHLYGDGTWLAEDGETLLSTLVEFFAETNLLSQPIAAMSLRQAQIAYSAGNLPTLASSESVASETLGLDNVEAHVDTGLEVMSRDFELMNDFHELEDDVGGSSQFMLLYSMPIPKLALDAMQEVTGGTVTNDYTSNRAMIYPRLFHALELHRQLARLKLEILWRRADGFNQCIDTGVCDPAAGPGCAEHCGYYEDALAFAADASEELDPMEEMLASHASWLMLEVCPFAAPAAPGARMRAVAGGPLQCLYDDPEELKETIAGLRAHITGTQDEMARASESLQAGNDAFGFRGLNHYPGDDIGGRIDDLVSGVLEMGQAYEGFVDDYLATLADYRDFESSVSSAATSSSVLLAGYCVDDQGVPQSGGCAVDESTWRSDHPLIAEVNEILASTLCSGDLIDYETGESLSIAPDHLDDNGYTNLFEIYEEYMTSLGLPTSHCPQLTAPDFAAWEGYGGSLAGDLSSMQVVLEQLGAHLSRFRSELYTQQTMSETIEVIQDGLDGASDSAQRAETIGAAIGCAMGIVVAVASQGTGMPVAAVTCSNLAIEAGAGVPIADTMEELQFELDTLFAGYTSLQNLMAIAFDIQASLQQYDAAVRSFEAHKAQFLNLQTNLEVDHRDLYENAFRFDPTNLLFADEQVASMALRFQSAMRDVRELEILVGYDLGAPLSEERGIYIQNDYYYLPRLADVTVAEKYGSDANAYVTLRGTTRPGDQRDVTLVAIASLLDAIRKAAQTLSGGEQTTHGFLSDPDSSGFDASGNPESFTEWMLLRRSPFYNAWMASDASGDDNGDGTSGEPCGVGEIDLYQYCKNANGAPLGPENNCFAVTDLDEVTRLNAAWLDTQIVGIGAVPFACSLTPGGYVIEPAVGANGAYLTIEELNPRETRDDPTDFDWYLPDFMETGTVTGVGGDVWYRDHVSREFYRSQTPTVRRLMDDVFDMAERGVVSIDVKTFMPGSYLFALHSSESANPNAVYDPVVNDFDLENWGLVGAMSAGQTFAERVTDVTILCTDDTACQGVDRDGSNAVESHYARMFYSGPGYQSTICVGSSHQEKSEWMIDDRSTQGSFAIKSSDSNQHEADAEWMSSRVDDPAASVKAGDLDEAPLQPTLAVIQLFGLTDSDGVAEPNPWVLHGDPFADDTPNLRLAFRYRYYASELSTNAQWSEEEGQDFYESAVSCQTPTGTYPW